MIWTIYKKRSYWFPTTWYSLVSWPWNEMIDLITLGWFLQYKGFFICHETHTVTLFMLIKPWQKQRTKQELEMRRYEICRRIMSSGIRRHPDCYYEVSYYLNSCDRKALQIAEVLSKSHTDIAGAQESWEWDNSKIYIVSYKWFGIPEEGIKGKQGEGGIRFW